MTENTELPEFKLTVDEAATICRLATILSSKGIKATLKLAVARDHRDGAPSAEAMDTAVEEVESMRKHLSTGKGYKPDLAAYSAPSLAVVAHYFRQRQGVSYELRYFNVPERFVPSPQLVSKFLTRCFELLERDAARVIN